MIKKITKKFKNILLDPYPVRTILVKLIKKFKLGSYYQRLAISAMDRPAYGHTVYHAAKLAQRLGLKRMSVLEFGVAKGTGLLLLEEHVREVSKVFDIEIEIYGFDTGEGLPATDDYRDIRYFWQSSQYKMDFEKLSNQLERAKLVIGNTKDTTKSFFKDYNPAPIGAIMFDLDYYSSTVDAFNLLEQGTKYFLPRVFCYFDDICGSTLHLFSDYTGERLAINEFNESHKDIKFSPAYYMYSQKVIEPWNHKIRICHFHKHDQYNTFIHHIDGEGNI